MADAFGLDIVTDSTNVHDIVAAHSAADVFDALLNSRTAPQPPTTQDSVDDLAQIVMTTAFDVSRLTPRQIADLVADGHDLRRFKNALVPIVASLPRMTDDGERQRRLEAAANEVLAEWSRYRKSLPQFALDAIVEVTDLKWPEFATAGLLLSPHTWWAGAGLGIGLLTHKGAKVFQKFREKTNSPYRYLSNIQKVSTRTQSSLSIAPPR